MSNDKITMTNLVGDAYKTWKKECIVFDAGTGSGKTHFCLNVLGEYAKAHNKKILYLCNRNALRKDIASQIEKIGVEKNIDLKTYQGVQSILRKAGSISFYDYVVADECHYFKTDAMFNEDTFRSYDYVMNLKESVVILMSATAKVFFHSLLSSGKVKPENYYYIEKDYSYVEKVFVYKKSELEQIIKRIMESENDSKLLVFCSSSKRMIDMYKKYGDVADYFCGTSAPENLKRICSPDCIKEYSDEKITFEKRILFTTTALDNGVNLKDKNIRHVFSELKDVDAMIQAFGRKRCINVYDTCFFYIKELSGQALQGTLNSYKLELEPVKMFKDDYERFLKEYPESGDQKKKDQMKRSQIYSWEYLRDGQINIRINQMRYEKYVESYEIINRMKEIGHVETLKEMLDKDLIKKMERISINTVKEDHVLEYLHSIEGKWLFKKERQVIKKMFEEWGLKVRFDGINTLNGALEDQYKSKYKCRFRNIDIFTRKKLVDKRRNISDGNVKKENPTRDKSYWILDELGFEEWKQQK